MMSNHTDMQDKYCGDPYDIHPIQSQYKGNHKRGGAAEGRVTSFVVAAASRHLCTLALNRVNIVAVTKYLLLDIMFLAIRISCSLAVPPNINPILRFFQFGRRSKFNIVRNRNSLDTAMWSSTEHATRSRLGLDAHLSSEGKQ